MKMFITIAEGFTAERLGKFNKSYFRLVTPVEILSASF